MLLTVCIEAGRKTLTHTSWTGLAPVSRKWMSGQAAALAATKDRTPFVIPQPLFAAIALSAAVVVVVGVYPQVFARVGELAF